MAIGIWIIWRYMSTMYRVPSGALAICTGRRQELDRFFVGGALGASSRSQMHDLLAMHNVLRAIGNESVAHVLPRPGVSPVDSQTARRREVARRASAGLDPVLECLEPPLRAQHPPRLLRADAIQSGLWPIDGDVHCGVGHRVIGVSVGIPSIEELSHDVSVLPAKELSSVVVEAHAVLPFAGLDNQPHGPGIESKITPERDGFCGGIPGIGDDPGVPVYQAVNLVVEAPSQTAEHPLGIKGAGAVSPAGEDDLLLIGNAVVVGVLIVEQIRGRSHEDAAAIAKDGRRPAQALRKDGGLVEPAVSVRILQ